MKRLMSPTLFARSSLLLAMMTVCACGVKSIDPLALIPSGDGGAPTVSSIQPLSGATDVALSAPIVVTFSEPMSPDSAHPSTTPAVTLTPSWDGQNQVLTLTPQPGWSAGQNYLFNIDAMNKAGDGLAIMQTIFTTKTQ